MQTNMKTSLSFYVYSLNILNNEKALITMKNKDEYALCSEWITLRHYIYHN